MTTVQHALAVLAAADDAVAGSLGCWRRPDGSLGDVCTRADWRAGLLDGNVDPEHLVRSIRLHQVLLSQPPDVRS
jgi:hypothetical protein